MRMLTSFAMLLLLGCGQSSTTIDPLVTPVDEAKQAAGSTENASASGDASEVELVVADSTQGANRESATTGAPRVVVTNTRHDFGEMNPHQFGEYEFVIRNVGDAPLLIETERSTCKCTMAELPGTPIPAGEETTIRLRWQTSLNNRRFEESATVSTNDPENPTLTFRVTGDVLVHVGANPPELVMSGVHPGRRESISSIVTSQVWESFEIEDITSSLEGFEWKVLPATEPQLNKLKAKSGHELTIQIPDDLPQGEFNHWVRFQLTPPDGESKMYELPLRGKVLRRVAVYGPGIDMTGTVTMGVIPSQKGHRRRLVVKVRDPLPELQVSQITCQPSFLEVKLTPYPAKVTSTKGLYYLDIEVPKASPVSRFQASEAGGVKIEFDHPRISDLELRIDFAVSNHSSRFSARPQINSPDYGIIAENKND